MKGQQEKADENNAFNFFEVIKLSSKRHKMALVES